MKQSNSQFTQKTWLWGMEVLYIAPMFCNSVTAAGPLWLFQASKLQKELDKVHNRA